MSWPTEVSRWWMPGQWIGGGEKPNWEKTAHRCHHPIRHGDRLYVSYWHGGFVILDIADLSRPKFVSGLDWSPPFPWPHVTAAPVRHDAGAAGAGARRRSRARRRRREPGNQLDAHRDAADGRREILRDDGNVDRLDARPPEQRREALIPLTKPWTISLRNN